jgi:hypothetical protein
MTLIDAYPDGPHALPGVVTHVVTVPELGLVYTSGQVASDKDGNLGGRGIFVVKASAADRAGRYQGASPCPTMFAGWWVVGRRQSQRMNRSFPRRWYCSAWLSASAYCSSR